jgi:uncharacterized protein YecE (DUF72 family)
MIRVGPAGWSYEDWEGIVYPDPKPRGFDPLASLAGYFDTVEVNSTFYRPAVRRTAESWARRVRGNDDFRFAVKLWRRFTHDRDEAWSAADVAAARQALDPLQSAGRLGAVLAQFPWSFKRTDESRAWLDDLTTAFEDVPLVVEVRHASWEAPEFFEGLAERGVGIVNVDQPLFGKSIKPSARATAPVGYVRLHGRNYEDWFREGAGVEARYDYLYSAKELEPWAERAKAVAAKAGEGAEVFVVTNNHFRGKAVANGSMLRSMIEEREVEAPPGVVAEYEEAVRGYARASARAAEGPG